MRVNWNVIKMVALLILVVFLYAFSSHRNNARIVSEPQVQFMGDNNLFISEETVSKLLIQNQDGVKKASKEILDLNQLESALNSNPMIKTAEVYVAVNGALKAKIEQKRPIARVHAKTTYYIDDQGSYMPLSKNYSARVPLVTGNVKKDDLDNVYKIAQKVYKDTFLKKHVIEIHQNEDQSISLRLRQASFTVYLGHLDQVEKKINNLKVFYQKAIKEKTLKTYSKINLQFDNQVVCTKT